MWGFFVEGEIDLYMHSIHRIRNKIKAIYGFY